MIVVLLLPQRVDAQNCPNLGINMTAYDGATATFEWSAPPGATETTTYAVQLYLGPDFCTMDQSGGAIPTSERRYVLTLDKPNVVFGIAASSASPCGGTNMWQVDTFPSAPPNPPAPTLELVNKSVRATYSYTDPHALHVFLERQGFDGAWVDVKRAYTCPQYSTDPKVVIDGPLPGGTYQYRLRTSNYRGNVFSETSFIVVPSPPKVVVLAGAKPMLQPAGQSSATTRFTVTNAGDEPTTVTLTRQGDFFAQSPATFSLTAGEEKVVSVEAVPSEAGAYSGASLLSGTGVPANLAVPIQLVSYAPVTEVQDIAPLQVRVDVSGSGDTASGSARFKNIGLSATTGVVSSDDVWLLPQTGIATIEPGQELTVPFTANRLLLGNPQSAASSITTLRFVHPPPPAGTARTIASSSGSGGAGLAVAVNFAQPTPKDLYAIPAGQIGFTLGGLCNFEGISSRLVSDIRLTSALGAALPPFELFFVDLASSVANASSLSQLAQPGGGLSLSAPAPAGDATDTTSAHLRGSRLQEISANATLLRINDGAREMFQLELPSLRSNAGAGPGENVGLPGAGILEGGSCRVLVQEVSGDYAAARVSVLDAIGAKLLEFPDRSLGPFEAAEERLSLPVGAATILVENVAAQGRIVAFAVQDGSDDGIVLHDPRYSEGAGTGPWIIPYVTGGKPSCTTSSLCLLNKRFALTLSARDQRTGKIAPGVPIAANDLFGYFSLPGLTGNAANPEVFVKMLDGTALNGEFWVFYGGLTDFEFMLSVTDTSTNVTSSYVKPSNSPVGGFDVGYGATDEDCPNASGVAIAVVTPFTCNPASEHLCLNGNRFRVELSARDQRTGTTGSGLSIPQNDLFGYFSIPALTTNPANPEVFVKVLDGRPVNGNFWVFYGGLTDLEYSITVTDSATGQRKTFGKEAGSACGGFDTGAFASGKTVAAWDSQSIASPGGNTLALPAEGTGSAARTAFALFNPSTSESRVQLEYRSASGSVGARAEIVLSAGATVEYEDVLTSLGIAAAGEGHLRITVVEGSAIPGAIRMAEGRSGKTVIATLPVVAEGDATPGGSNIALGPFDDASAESKLGGVPAALTPTLGLVETSGNAISIEVSVSYSVVRDLAQGLKGKKTFTLGANQLLLVPDMVREVVGASRENVGDLHDVTVTFRGVSGSGRFLPFVVSECVATGDARVIVR